jgi:hypothetical protein
MTRTHHHPTACRDAACHEKAVEGNAFIAQRIALVDANNDRRKSLNIVSYSKGGPREGITRIEGMR